MSSSWQLLPGESEVLVPVAMFKDGLAPNVSMVLDPAAADGGGSPLFNLSLCLRARLLRNSPGAFVTYLTGESDKILDAGLGEIVALVALPGNLHCGISARVQSCQQLLHGGGELTQVTRPRIGHTWDLDMEISPKLLKAFPALAIIL